MVLTTYDLCSYTPVVTLARRPRVMGFLFTLVGDLECTILLFIKSIQLLYKISFIIITILLMLSLHEIRYCWRNLFIKSIQIEIPQFQNNFHERPTIRNNSWMKKRKRAFILSLKDIKIRKICWCLEWGFASKMASSDIIRDLDTNQLGQRRY